MSNKKYWLFIYLIPIIISMGLGVFLGARHFASPPQLTAAQLLPSSMALPDFSLENHRGETINSAIFRGNWNLVFFGFSSCPDICPLELQKLGKLLRLADNNAPLQVVFVSIDPERDSPEKLASYTAFFHPKILGVTGKNAELARLANFFGAAYDRSVIVDDKLLSVPAGIDMPDNAGDIYQVNHSTRFFIVNPAGQIVGSFAPPHDAEVLWQDMEILLKAARD